MKHRKIFIFMMIAVMTTVYGLEKHRAKPPSTTNCPYTVFHRWNRQSVV
ncbi:MAG: hypothetical protein SOX26_06560 [Phocaeicola sp.]|nr:hypothetical protein [Phocaeicola sp.]